MPNMSHWSGSVECLITVASNEHQATTFYLPLKCLIMFVHADIKYNIKSLHHWHFVRGFHRWAVVSPHNKPVKRNAFHCRNVILWCLQLNSTQDDEICNWFIFGKGNWGVCSTGFFCIIKENLKALVNGPLWGYKDQRRAKRLAITVPYTRTHTHTSMLTSSNGNIFPVVMGNHRPLVDSPPKGQWREALIFYFICAWTICWANNIDACHLRRHLFRYADFHYKDNTVVRSSFLNNGNSYAGKTTSLYWDGTMGYVYTLQIDCCNTRQMTALTLTCLLNIHALLQFGTGPYCPYTHRDRHCHWESWNDNYYLN